MFGSGRLRTHICRPTEGQAWKYKPVGSHANVRGVLIVALRSPISDVNNRLADEHSSDLSTLVSLVKHHQPRQKHSDVLQMVKVLTDPVIQKPTSLSRFQYFQVYRRKHAMFG